MPLAAARADGAPVEVYPRVVYTFGEQILFEVHFKPDNVVREAVIFYRPQWQRGETLHGQMSLEDDNTAFFVHDLQQAPLPPFITVRYWFRLTLADGSSYTTPPFVFQLEDNRFQWQQMSDLPFTVFWYQGDAPFAQKVLDAATQGARRAQEKWLAPVPEAVNIYVYADAQAMQSALSTQGWVAGHASPAYGALYVTLADTPSQAVEIRRLVPHELAHYLLYQQTGETGYHNIPVWLNEGLASSVELSPNPDYAITLRQAVTNRRLIPMRDLCHDFPNDASGALLAYAEATSFTQYLLHRYGRSAMHNLIAAYAEGLDCNAGAQRILGQPLDRLEQAWLAETFHVGRWSQAIQHMRPWLLLLAVILLSLAAGAWLVSSRS